MATYKCLLCGQVFEVKEGEPVVCPLCGATPPAVEEVK